MDAFRVTDRVLGAVGIVGATIYLAIAWRIPAFALGTVPIQSRVFPLGLGALMLVLGVVLFSKAPAAAPRASEEDGAGDAPGEPDGEEITVARLADPRLEVLVLLAGVAAYILAFVPLGFVLSTVLYLVAVAWWFGFTRPFVALAVAIGIAATSHVGLVELLGVRLPSGLLAPLGL